MFGSARYSAHKSGPPLLIRCRANLLIQLWLEFTNMFWPNLVQQKWLELSNMSWAYFVQQKWLEFTNLCWAYLEQQTRNRKILKRRKNVVVFRWIWTLSLFPLLIFEVFEPVSSCWATLPIYKPMVGTYIINFNMENISKFDVSFYLQSSFSVFFSVAFEFWK